MNTVEAGQVWSNDTKLATVTNVATSYNDTYVRYTLADNTQHETNLHTFHLYFPTEVVKAVEVTKVTKPVEVAEVAEVAEAAVVA